MAKLLNIGSINIDHVYAVPHFVAEGETLSSLSLRDFPGGKGLNQSIALARAGAEVSHAGKVGPDGGALVALMQRAGVDTRLVETAPGPSGHTVIQVTPEGLNSILLYPGANHEIDERCIDVALKSFGAGDILVLQNEVSCIGHAMKAAHEKGMLVAFNPSPFDGAVPKLPLEAVRWFLLNEPEGRGITGKTEPEDILDTLSRMFPGSGAVLTLGKRGAIFRDCGETLYHGIYDVKAVDTTAAGDTFTGFFLATVAAGKPASEALRLASAAASIAVSRPGAASSIPTLGEVLRFQNDLIRKE
jgi:ribokinase